MKVRVLTDCGVLEATFAFHAIGRKERYRNSRDTRLQSLFTFFKVLNVYNGLF